MLRFIYISLLLLCVSNITHAQYDDSYTGEQSDRTTQRLLEEGEEDERPPKIKKEYPYKERGTAITLDLSQFAIPFIYEGTQNFQAGIRSSFQRRWFIVANAGYENIDFDDKSYSYKSSGFYGRVGLDYDILIVDEPGSNDNIFVGFRYGFAHQNHESPQATIEDSYWGDYTISVPRYGLSSHWLEFTAGIRAEVLKNFYMGWFVRVKGKMNTSNSESLEPYRIPGYGKGQNFLNLGFGYNIEYLLPWGNKKSKYKPKVSIPQ